MARAILLAGAALWLVAGLAALAVAALATPQLERLLPPLAIDTDALRGTVVALGVALAAVGVIHIVVLAALRARRRWGSTVAILLGALLAASLVALGAAAATSAVRSPEAALPLLAGAVGAGVAACAYAVLVARLVAARRSRSAV